MTQQVHLSDIAVGQTLEVIGLDSTQNVPNQWFEWLEQIGFIPGEHCEVMHRVHGRFPMAVRIGVSTFALREDEAKCIWVKLLDTTRPLS